MKYIKSLILFAALGVLGLSSCDGFLDMQPTSSGNAETAIATPADAQVVMNGIMRGMSSSNYYGRNFIMYGDAKGGDLTIYSAGRGLDALYSFNHSATSNSYSGFWSTGYYCIMQINNLLENIERLETEGVEGFSFYKGQALTLRALIYFDLVRLYGLPYNYNKSSYGVPNVTETLGADAQPVRASVEENYNQILADLEAGKSLLESNKSLQNGYVGYYANIALQARVKLYMENYDGALAAAKEIIEKSNYKLYGPADWVASWTKQYGSESIFEIGIDTESDLGTASLGLYLMRFRQISAASGWFLASDYYLDRLNEDNTDVRWGVMGNDEYWVNNGIERKGACYKYLGSTSLDGDGKETYTAVNIKVIRLSEIYLIAAEAALNASTPDKAAAAGYLNEIRKRAPELPLATAATITDDLILEERSKELFCEGQRFFDLIRKNKTIEFNDDFQGVPVSRRGKTIDRTFGMIVLPISQSEINANPALKDQQNEAYK
ncbi:RagB/SusD family nutrient uptake outer membrane protein [Parabacteroides sp. Marseille-P3160]|uniref:RagB/SusD family nutrient uptake outer membrane protein n=1 Tax=Parabacteroides sp. Marseille-P3160 TaxID=1917887 RepID=UPI0009B96C77|nr:RagB/SusD family nutrient uptake outer membrane protein [Parabacteroides sp. Marseille-P3160]